MRGSTTPEEATQFVLSDTGSKLAEWSATGYSDARDMFSQEPEGTGSATRRRTLTPGPAAGADAGPAGTAGFSQDEEGRSAGRESAGEENEGRKAIVPPEGFGRLIKTLRVEALDMAYPNIGNIFETMELMRRGFGEAASLGEAEFDANVLEKEIGRLLGKGAKRLRERDGRGTTPYARLEDRVGRLEKFKSLWINDEENKEMIIGRYAKWLREREETIKKAEAGIKVLRVDIEEDETGVILRTCEERLAAGQLKGEERAGVEAVQELLQPAAGYGGAQGERMLQILRDHYEYARLMAKLENGKTAVWREGRDQKKVEQELSERGISPEDFEAGKRREMVEILVLGSEIAKTSTDAPEIIGMRKELSAKIMKLAGPESGDSWTGGTGAGQDSEAGRPGTNAEKRALRFPESVKKTKYTVGKILESVERNQDSVDELMDTVEGVLKHAKHVRTGGDISENRYVQLVNDVIDGRDTPLCRALAEEAGLTDRKWRDSGAEAFAKTQPHVVVKTGSFERAMENRGNKTKVDETAVVGGDDLRIRELEGQVQGLQRKVLMLVEERRNEKKEGRRPSLREKVLAGVAAASIALNVAVLVPWKNVYERVASAPEAGEAKAVVWENAQREAEEATSPLLAGTNARKLAREGVGEEKAGAGGEPPKKKAKAKVKAQKAADGPMEGADTESGEGAYDDTDSDSEALMKARREAHGKLSSSEKKKALWKEIREDACSDGNDRWLLVNGGVLLKAYESIKSELDGKVLWSDTERWTKKMLRVQVRGTLNQIAIYSDLWRRAGSMKPEMAYGVGMKLVSALYGALGGEFWNGLEKAQKDKKLPNLDVSHIFGQLANGLTGEPVHKNKVRECCVSAQIKMVLERMKKIKVRFKFLIAYKNGMFETSEEELSRTLVGQFYSEIISGLETKLGARLSGEKRTWIEEVLMGEGSAKQRAGRIINNVEDVPEGRKDAIEKGLAKKIGEEEGKLEAMQESKMSGMVESLDKGKRNGLERAFNKTLNRVLGTKEWLVRRIFGEEEGRRSGIKSKGMALYERIAGRDFCKSFLKNVGSAREAAATAVERTLLWAKRYEWRKLREKRKEERRKEEESGRGSSGSTSRPGQGSKAGPGTIGRQLPGRGPIRDEGDKKFHVPKSRRGPVRSVRLGRGVRAAS